MTTLRKPILSLVLSSSLLLTGAMTLGGCVTLETPAAADQESTPTAAADNQPYYANEFSDLMIPNELKWNREKSLLVRTESFTGGVLLYSGNVDINSLADFFTNTMVKNGWKLAGSAKYKNVLLAFVKPGKTCTITINDGDLGLQTDVNIYITEDNSSGSGMTSPTTLPAKM